MRCAYCGVEITNYPDNGICVHCGGTLPERPAGMRCPGCGAYSTGSFCSACGRSLTGAVPPIPPVQPIYVQTPQTSLLAACPKCGNTQVLSTRRGFRWGLALLGFILVPIFGILLGFCGSKNACYQCAACGKKWKPH